MEITGGIDPIKAHQGGTIYEVIPDPNREIKEDDESADYVDSIKDHVKMECLDGEVHEEESGFGVPFPELARQMTNLISNGKVKKRILRKGYGSMPSIQSTVKIHYNAYVECEALPVDSTYSRKQPYSFILGDGSVIEGLDVAASSMLISEKSEFLIHPDMSYKNSGLKRIPPNSTILFEIEMLDTRVSEPDDRTKERMFSVVHEQCEALCAKAKRMFKMQDYIGAIKEYEVALDKLENSILQDYSDQLKSDEMLLKLLTNLLICFATVESPKRGCSCANRIYDLLRNHETLKLSPRIYFNNAKCLQMLGDFGLARRRLHLAQQLLPPGDPGIAKELVKLTEAENKYKEYKKTFGQNFLR